MIESIAGIDHGFDQLEARASDLENPSLPTLMSLAAGKIASGTLEEAEGLVSRILGVSENTLAENDPDFVIGLNDLIRLSLKQSAHAVAEPLLLRLLAIKQGKGEDHPEVATVLASLATVRHTLGRHESAEQLWRRVLVIRERTLAPNHFAIAIALEHLAEACAARGKTGEAVRLFQRAHGMRELTLGADHASLRASRDRIGDLQLQASEEPLDAPIAEPTASAPDRYRLLSAEHVVDSAPRLPRGRTAVKQWKPMARVIEDDPSMTERVAEASPTYSPVTGIPTADKESAEPSHPPYMDAILSIQQELEDEEQLQAATGLVARLFASAVVTVKQRQRETMIGAGAVALLAVFAAVSYGWNASEPSKALEDARIPAPISSLQAAQASNVGPILTKGRAAAPVTAAAAAVPVGASRARLADQRSAAKKSERDEPARISIPKVSASLTAGFDRVVGTPNDAVGDPLANLPAPPPVSGKRLSFGNDEQLASPQRSRLIGKPPTPRYPRYLGNVEGEVQVRFDVDPLGVPVMSSVSVIQSSNALFTAEVLKVVRSLRFEPARSAGPDRHAVSDVVEMGFTFQPAK